MTDPDDDLLAACTAIATIPSWVATDGRDWSVGEFEARLWAVTHGWGEDPDPEEAQPGLLESVARSHGWPPVFVDRLRMLRQGWKALPELLSELNTLRTRVRAASLHEDEIKEALATVRNPDAPYSHAALTLAETVEQLQGQVAALTAERDAARAKNYADALTRMTEVFAADNGLAGIIPISAQDAQAIRSSENRRFLLHAYRTEWEPLEPAVEPTKGK